MTARQQVCARGHVQTPKNYFNYNRKGQYAASGCKECRRVRDRARYAKNAGNLRIKRMERYRKERQWGDVRKNGKGHDIALEARQRLLHDITDPAIAELLNTVPIGEYYGRDSD